ncbi:MAG: ATP-grasp domain-containing protein [Pelovirga sp.]
MKVAVCFNLAATAPLRGELHDRISEAGAETEANAVADALRRLGHVPALVPLGTEVVSFIGKLQLMRPAVIFNLCEGFRGDSSREMHIAALFELLDIPYTGSSPAPLLITQDKALTKDLLVRHGLPTPEYYRVRIDDRLPKIPVKTPFIVKPCCEDASLSIGPESIVTSELALKKRVRYIHDRYAQDALVEKYIDGREFNASVLGNAPTAILPLAEISFAAGLACNIVSYAGKWESQSADYRGTTPVCPARVAEKERKTIEATALKACRLLGCRDYARVDIRLHNGIPYILEINANPDICPDAGFARSARAAGYNYPDLIQRILNMALARKGAGNA